MLLYRDLHRIKPCKRKLFALPGASSAFKASAVYKTVYKTAKTQTVTQTILCNCLTKRIYMYTFAD